MIDLVKMFEDAATVYGYRFAYGAKDILNYEAGQADLISGEYIVMIFPFVETANLANNIMNGFKVSTQVWLGRKFDVTSASGTKSNIDETEKQKYDRRLKTMRTAMEAYIKYVFCSNDPALTSVRIFRELNRFTTNIDFITADITFEYDNEYEPEIIPYKILAAKDGKVIKTKAGKSILIK
jgi:hypothetical protein